MRTESLAMITIYEGATDYPGKFVARRCTITAAGVVPDAVPLAVVATLEAARAAIPNRHVLVCIARSPTDERQIVETWV